MVDLSLFRYDGSRALKLKELDPACTAGFDAKEQAALRLAENTRRMAEEQGKLYADGKYAVLLILQAMDAAGKDGAIARVMGGLNPQGTQVHSFKQPTSEELAHDYLWRANRHLPERGCIGIFNRSYYEEVLVVRVHDLIHGERLPEALTGDVWGKRFEQIRHYESYLAENGILPVKVFLHISKEEQKKRLLSRIENQAKNWKFSEADIRERQFWHQYQRCYEEAINRTATKAAPWYVVPADKKWYSRLVLSELLVKTLKSLDLKYPELGPEQQAVLEKYRVLLENGQENAED